MRTLVRTSIVTATLVGTTLLAGTPASAAPSDQDTTWVKAAHQSNLAEIAAGTAAQKSATTDDVRKLGAMWIQMHTELDNSLKTAAKQLDVNLPDGPTADQKQKLAAVTEKSGQSFDTAWIAEEIGGHSTTLAATKRELSTGSDDQVLKLARTATPVVEQHLTELRSAARKYGAPRSVPSGTGGQAADDGLRTTGWGVAGLGGLLLAAGATVLGRRRTTGR